MSENHFAYIACSDVWTYYRAMMRRGLVVCAVFALLFAPIAPASAASVGGKCAPLGKKVTSSKSVLICKKNTKGIAVWTKTQTKVVKPAVVPSPPPRPLEIWEVTEGILNSVWAKKTAVQNKIKIEYQVGLSPEAWVTEAIDSLKPSQEFFSALGIPISSDTTLVVGEFDFVSKRTRELGCRTIGANEVSDNCAPRVLFLNTSPTSFIHDRGSVLIHEAFHQAQTDAAESVGRNHYYFPGWMRQGGAEMMRNFVYGKITGRGYKAMRDFQITHPEPGCDTFSLKENIAQFRMTNTSYTCNYTGGLLTMERLIAVTQEPRTLFSWIERKDAPLALYTQVVSQWTSYEALTRESYSAAIEMIYSKPVGVFESEMETYVRSTVPRQ